MKRNNKKGFTIVELVIVIAVIAILAGVLIPTFAGVTNKAKESKALQEAKNAYTNDLALLDGQVEADISGKVYVKTTDDAYNAEKTYYTKNGENYVEAEIDKFAANTTYYEVEFELAGTFDVLEDGDGYTYEYNKNGYTCKYDGDDWSIVEKKAN